MKNFLVNQVIGEGLSEADNKLSGEVTPYLVDRSIAAVRAARGEAETRKCQGRALSLAVKMESLAGQVVSKLMEM